MNRVNKILCSLRLINSRLSKSHSLHQVTKFPLPISPAQLCTSTLLPTHQKLLFSSKPEPVVDLVLSEDWSQLLEQELSRSNPKLTHETVIYLLKKLDKDPLKALNFFNWVNEKTGFEHSSATYTLFLQILANKDSMKEFWVTANKIKELGFYIDEDTCHTIHMGFKSLKRDTDATAFADFCKRLIKDNAMGNVVNEVVEIVTRSEWGREVEKSLIEMKISVSDNFVVWVLKELRWNPLKALEVFKWFAKGCGFKHNTMTYNAAARVLARDDTIEEFWSMVSEMTSKDHDLDIDTYIKISRRFQKRKMLKDAVKLYEHMMDGPYKPSIHECSLLLRSISVDISPDLDLVLRVVKKYEAAGHSLSKTAYDGIHRSLTRLGRFDEAENIMETMTNAGYEPDNITYSQLICGLGKSGRLEEACKVLDVMEANGCVPDIMTWTILIQGQCAAGELDKALFYFAKMMEKDCDPDADLLDVLLNGFINQKRISGAYTLLVELVNKAHVRPWQHTYKNLIQYLLGENKLDEALNLLQLMRKHNHPPFPEPFHQYVSKYGTMEDALSFLKALSSKEYPTISAYQRVFESLFQEGRHSEAKDLLYKCPLHIRKHKAISSLFGSVEDTSSAAA